MIESRPPTATAPLAPGTTTPDERASVWRRWGDDTRYLLASAVLAVAGFVAVVTGVCLGIGLLVLWVGLPVLVGTVLLARGLAQLQRLSLGRRSAVPATLPEYRRAAAQAGRVRRFLAPLSDPQSWLDVLWCVVALVTALTGAVVALSWWAAALGGLTYWFWQQWLPQPDTTLAGLMGLGPGRRPEILLNLGIGVVALLTVPLVTQAAAGLHAGLSDGLLCSRARLQEQLRRFSDSRDAARRAEAGSLRRLERDIHDGPQQRLVRLALDLGRARKKLDASPEQAGQLIDGALRQARETVAELRALSRGIAPPLLVDRGLGAALEELVERSSVSTSLDTDLPAALPPHVEATAYFVVAEALTNVAKHSGARSAVVTATHADGWLAVVVEDDGAGGAHLAKGSGLAGLAERLVAADGVLEVDSPPGGPTVVSAVMPSAAER